MESRPAPESPRSDQQIAETELLILPDGRVFAHNLTVPLHEVLSSMATSPTPAAEGDATPLANRSSES